ncbi:MAG: SIS domain-containing protein, partial [Clostridiales bacterium]|nr:SIS domain-containing protein [Clostridiales bacterium]
AAEAARVRGVNVVITAARGSSNNAAVFFKQYNEFLGGLPVAQTSPYISTFFGAAPDLSRALYVVVSQSGRSPDTVTMLRNAKRNGALTVAVTNASDSPIAREADFLLSLEAGEERAVAATKTFTAELAALAILAEALNGAAGALTPAVAEKAREVTEASVTPDAVLQASQSAIILSRGLTEAVAKEFALKITETTYKFTFASSTNEFKHGPQALVADGTPVILLAPDGDFRTDFISAAETFKKRGAHIIAFTDIEEVAAVADSAVRMPPCGGTEAAFVYAPAIQVYAEALAVSLRLSPDAPRNLNKVTVTE